MLLRASAKNTRLASFGLSNIQQTTEVMVTHVIAAIVITIVIAIHHGNTLVPIARTSANLTKVVLHIPPQTTEHADLLSGETIQQQADLSSAWYGPHKPGGPTFSPAHSSAALHQLTPRPKLRWLVSHRSGSRETRTSPFFSLPYSTAKWPLVLQIPKSNSSREKKKKIAQENPSVLC